MRGADRAKVMITVKAYPQLSQKSGEVVCVAGVRIDKEQPEWIRLFPVPYRDLPEAARFKKYDIVELDVAPGRDSRPESFIPSFDRAEVVDHVPSGRDGLWRKRRQLIGPLLAQTTACELLAANRGGGRKPSLGLIKPASIEGVDVVPTPGFDADKRRLAELAAEETLLGPAKRELEPAPWTVHYRYRCEAGGCPGHSQSLIDWELGEAGRKWASSYLRHELANRIRDKFYDQLCGPDRDPHFYLGNQRLHLQSFLVLGVYWPKLGPAEDPPPVLF